ncbi:MAG: aminopeptidase P family protein [Tannerellaceae bacterium]|nr:aminopeptidase P family protein [Tannerellaceae bacterium]
MNTIILKRISQLRDRMAQHGIDAYIIPGSDPHLSEYPADCWKAREWISGFNGSAGTIVVTRDKAGLWTDSRYFLQAEIQLEGTGIDLYKLKLPETLSIPDFITREIGKGGKAGFDGNSYSVTEYQSLKQVFDRKNIIIESFFDLVGEIWTDRPPIPAGKIFELPVEITGLSVSDKLDTLNNKLREAGADCTILGALDDIAWSFNIRGNDVPYNPVAISYAFISEEERILFIRPEKLTGEIALHLKKEGVILADYSKITTYLQRLPEKTRILVDPDRTNTALYKAIPGHCRIIEQISPAAHLKSIKNETEIEGFRQVAVKDGIALTRFYLWLEKQLQEGNKITELSASAKLSALRAEQPLAIGDSFKSISSYGAHGAIVHYTPTEETDTEIKPEGSYLLDSGGQYLDGTTDITRTIPLSEPTEQIKKDFTRTLKGMISLSKCKFPAGTRGCQLDILARKALWDAGINYLHGTGHGIGYCLNVHEGPQSIRMEENPVLLQPGMVMSNEPAMYRTGEYGIRTENMMLIREDSETEFGKFYSFETLTLCYIDTRLIISSMLSPRELAWLNRYHQKVYDKLSPHLNEEEQIWLKEKTKGI